MENLLLNILTNIEELNKLIDSGEISGVEYGLFTFTEESEVINDILEDIKEGIAIAKMRNT